MLDLPLTLIPVLLGMAAVPVAEIELAAQQEPSAAEEGIRPGGARPETLPAREPAWLGSVNNARAAASVRELVALGPRMGGTTSGEAAATWLEDRFKGMGLATVRHLGAPQWCHMETEWSVKVSVDGSEPETLERVWPWGFSPAGSGEGLALTLEATPGLAQITGRFSGTRRKAEPAGVVLVDTANTLEGDWPVCRPHPRGSKARVAAFGIVKADGQRLRAALEAGSSVTVDWSLETEIKKAEPVTVIATLPAREGAPKGHLLVCAHGDSDSGGPGANDNASGVAIVLEMARAWSIAVREKRIPAPEREVRFAIWGSEITSTRAYMKSELGADILGVINFDQAGYGRTGQRLHVEPDDLAANKDFIDLAVGLLRERAGTPGFPARWATNKSLGGTDSYVFSGSKRFRKEGLPAVTLYTSAWGSPDEQPSTAGMPGESWTDRDKVTIDYDEHYHSMGDTPENTTDKEPENMGWCARVGLLVSQRWLASLPDSPAGGLAAEKPGEGAPAEGGGK